MSYNKAFESIGVFFRFLIDEYGFKVLNESQEGSNFASLIVFVSEELQIRFALDRGHPYIDLGPPNSDTWCSLTSIHKLITGYWLTSQETKVSDLASFLKSHYDQVVSLFLEEEISTTLRRIEDVEQRWRDSYLDLH